MAGEPKDWQVCFTSLILQLYFEKAYYAFEQCSKIQPIMLKIMLSKSRLCSRVGCFIRVYQSFLTVVLE